MRGGKLIRLIIFSLALSFYGTSYAQEIKGMRSSKSTVCYGMAVDHNVVIPPPAQYIEWQNNPHARTQTATFDVTYVGFTAEAKAAFQKAVDIWSTLLKTSQIIHVHAEWKTLDAGVLGSASWANAFANFPGAPQVDTFYPVALAEKIANKELNGSTDADIFAKVNFE